MIGRRLGSVTPQNRRHAPGAVHRGGLVQLGRDLLQAGQQRHVVCGMPTQTPTTITAGSAVEKSPSQLMSSRQAERAEERVERPAVGRVDHLPHDRHDDRRHRPRHEREHPGEPLQPQLRVEQQREPERGDELQHA